jgi:hypothetical protein
VRTPVVKPEQKTPLQRLVEEAKAKPPRPEDRKGQPVTLGGKRIPLPPDAYLEEVVVSMNCAPLPGTAAVCPELPLAVIRRGQSRLFVSMRSGKISHEQTVAGEESAFHVLRAALR